MNLLTSVQASCHRFSLRVGAKKRARGVVLTPHPGPLPVEGRGGLLPRSIWFRCAASGAPSPLNGVRGEAYLRHRNFSVTLWVFASTCIVSLLARESIAAEPASTNLLSLQSVLGEVFSNN